MHVEVDDDAAWVGERESVFFRAKADGRSVRCFVSREASDDHFGGNGAKDYAALFNAHRKTILTVAEQLIEQGMVSPAGELVVSTKYF